MRNEVFEVIYQRSHMSQVFDEVHHVQADSIETVMLDSIEHAKAYNENLISVRYLFNIAKRLTSE